MNQRYYRALMVIFFSACSSKEDVQESSCEIPSLAIQVRDLRDQNNNLSTILRRMSSNHTSLRPFTSGLIEDIESVKHEIISHAAFDSTSVQNEVDNIVSVRERGTYYPRSFTFSQKQIPQKLAHLTLKSLAKFDRHPITKSQTLQTFLDEVNLTDGTSEERLRMYDELNLGQTVHLLEVVQIYMLLEENKYLTSQFDNAINRMIAYQLNYLPAPPDQKP